MLALAFLVVGALVICDQLTKYMVVSFIKPSDDVSVIGELLKFTYLENRGAAFGILQNQRWIFIIITVLIICAFIWMMIRYEIKSKMLYAASLLIVAGGVGNLIDRIFLGYVVDFIKVSFFPPVFNFADCCVTIGCALLIISVIAVKTPIVKKTKKD